MVSSYSRSSRRSGRSVGIACRKIHSRPGTVLTLGQLTRETCIGAALQQSPKRVCSSVFACSSKYKPLRTTNPSFEFLVNVTKLRMYFLPKSQKVQLECHSGIFYLAMITSPHSCLRTVHLLVTNSFPLHHSNGLRRVSS